MSYDDFIQHYNRVYVARLLTDDAGQVWTKKTIFGEFKGENAGGCTTHPTFPNNPQISLTVDKPSRVFINLSQPDLRFLNKKNPGAFTKSYDPIGVVVFKSDTNKFKLSSFNPENRVAGSAFAGVRDNSLEFVAQPGHHHIIVPSTYHPGVELKYELDIYTEFKSDISEITTVLPVKKVNGEWKGPTAGGCLNEPTVLKNPQFLLEVEKSGEVHITLSQVLAEKQRPEAIGIYVFARHTPDHIDVKPPREERVVSSKEYLDTVTTSEKLEAKEGLHYIVLPTTFDAGINREFVLSVSSADTPIKTFRLIQ